MEGGPTPSITTESALPKPPARSQARGKRERPCDGCRRRKGRCVPVEGQTQCAACAVHNQPCTFVEDPKPRKRKTENGSHATTPTSAKKKSQTYPQPGLAPATPSARIMRDAALIGEPATMHSAKRSVTYISTATEHQTRIGLTTEYDPFLMKQSKSVGDAGLGTIRDHGQAAFFIRQPTSTNTQKMIMALQVLLKPCLANMADVYRRTIHESFPIIDDAVLAQLITGNMSGCDTLVTAAMLLAVSPWYERQEEKGSLARYDRTTLEGFTFGLFTQSLYQPTLNTVQAGLLLMQCPSVDTKALHSQLTEISYDLGLNLDCSTWELAASDRALRRRLAWAVYMQDKWCALIHGRPSAIANENWAVSSLSMNDFSSAQSLVETADMRVRRHALFVQTVNLTIMLAEIMSAFYTVNAMHGVEKKGSTSFKHVLEETKGVQGRLKEWFCSLPPSLQMNPSSSSTATMSASANSSSLPTPGEPNSSLSALSLPKALPTSSSSSSLSTSHSLCPPAFLHLAYYTTEITLHRVIIHAQPSDPIANAGLVDIVRTGAKERLISALEFTNRLRASALQGFWYFAARSAFAIVGTFGALLAATSPAREEFDFYVARLIEFRWTLGVDAARGGGGGGSGRLGSGGGAAWLQHAARTLDANLVMLEGVLEKPTAGELAEQRQKKENKQKSVGRKAGRTNPSTTGIGSAWRSGSHGGGSNRPVEMLDMASGRTATDPFTSSAGAVAAMGGPMSGLTIDEDTLLDEEMEAEGAEGGDQEEDEGEEGEEGEEEGEEDEENLDDDEEQDELDEEKLEEIERQLEAQGMDLTDEKIAAIVG